MNIRQSIIDNLNGCVRRPTSNSPRKAFFYSWVIIIATAATLSLLFKIVIAINTFGTNDVLYWQTFLQTAKHHGGLGLYHQVWYFNHPPFMIHVLRVMDFTARSTGIPFPFLLRLPAIVADLGSLFLVWRILKQDRQRKIAPLALLLMAIAPTSIMVSGFHGNTDPLMIFLVLLSVYLIEKRYYVWVAGVAMGMALNIKVLPMIFIPAIFLYLPTIRERMEYLSAMVAIFFAGSLPYILQDPWFIINRVFGYRSIYGQWGLSRIMTSSLLEHHQWLNSAYATYGRFALFAVIVLISAWMNWVLKRPPLFFQLGLIIFTFMSLTMGFGIQYLSWLVPWVVGLGVVPTALYYLLSGIFQFLVYNYWSLGFPWYLANSDQVGPWKGYLIYYELLCWAVVVAITLIYLRSGTLINRMSRPVLSENER